MHQQPDIRIEHFLRQSLQDDGQSADKFLRVFASQPDAFDRFRSFLCDECGVLPEADLPGRLFRPGSTIRDVANRVAEAIGDGTCVPVLANRQSYFTKKLRHLGRWNVVSRLYRLVPPVDLRAFGRAIDDVIARHDALRLRARVTYSGITENIAPPDLMRVLRIVTLPTSAAQPFAAIAAEVCDEQRDTDLSGDLFRVLLFIDAIRQTHWYCIIAHHILADAFSFRKIASELSSLYAHSSDDPGAVPPLRSPARSYRIFASKSLGFWLRRAPGTIGHWRELPWGRVAPLCAGKNAADPANREAYTVHVSCAVEASVERRLRDLPTHHRLEHRILVAVARAFGAWRGHEAIQLALVLHGRTEESIAGPPERAVGWISETVPIVLRTTGALRCLDEETRRQVEAAARMGRAFGVLRHVSAAGGAAAEFVRSCPEPEISLNINLGHPSTPRVGDRVEVEAPGPALTLTEPEAQRVFLLSGGVFRRDGRLQFAWDFSRLIFSEEDVRRFARLCSRELGATLHALEREPK